MKKKLNSRLLQIVLFAIFACLSLSHARGQMAPMTLKKAMSATELPVGAWGPYSRTHLGPCYMASRKNGQMFTFPVVVGQQRDEILPFGGKTPDGKVRLKPERIALVRRAMGLSPTSAGEDAGGRPPIAAITEGDASGLLWTARAEFPEAEVKQAIARRKDAQGQPLPPVAWGAGAADVSYFPAFGEHDVEGLILRVALHNRSDIEQTYFIDIFSGIEAPDDAFTQQDLTWTVDLDGHGIAMQHSKSENVYAVEALAGDYAVRSHIATSALFAANANICQRETTGALLPFGQQTGEARSAEQDPSAKPWGLLRVSGISVAPGGTRTVFLTVGIGKDAAAAHASGRTLLAQAADIKLRGKPDQEGLFSRAQKAHAKVRYECGDTTLNRLMAQSVSNTPFTDFRRVGAPSRESGGTYRAGVGGWMALGWSVYRPDWSAAQLNAWFLSNSPVPQEIKIAQAIPPIDLFALWELVQRTHDRDLMTRFYPYAVWRYQQFLEAGRQKEGDWLFGWPVAKANFEEMRTAGPDDKRKAEMAAYYSPDYSAYVIRAARLLLACARILDKPGVETDRFTRDIDRTTAAMNSTLWDAKRGVFVSRPVTNGEPVSVMDIESPMQENGLDGLLPLIAGPAQLTMPQRESLVKTLVDETAFWGPAGLRSVSKASPDYKPGDGFNGGVRFGAQWMFWKALLDMGEEKRASELSGRVLNAYHTASEHAGACPEWLNADTGAPGGYHDYTGDSCALFALYESYHVPGTVSCGWDMYVLDHQYDKNADTMRVVFRALEEKPKGIMLCTMGKPNGKYKLTGGVTGSLAADSNGVLALRLPDHSTNQQVEITPHGDSR